MQIQSGLPLLRSAKGRIVFTSSGAAVTAYTSWGAYGATKAAVNHLAMTLKNEEPEVTSVSIRPGVVDTAMQDDIRNKYLGNMDEKDQQKFVSAKKDGKLLPAEKPGHVIAELAVRATKELSGQFLRYVSRSITRNGILINIYEQLGRPETCGLPVKLRSNVYKVVKGVRICFDGKLEQQRDSVG